MPSIALVEPRAPNYHVYSFAALPRLGLPSMGAILRGLGHQVRVYCQSLGKLNTAYVGHNGIVWANPHLAEAQRRFLAYPSLTRDKALVASAHYP